MLAWLLCGKGGIVSSVVGLLGSVGLGVYRREEGEETVNIKHTDVTQMHDMTTRRARGDLSQYYTLPTKGKTSGNVFPAFGISDR